MTGSIERKWQSRSRVLHNRRGQKLGGEWTHGREPRSCAIVAGAEHK